MKSKIYLKRLALIVIAILAASNSLVISGKKNEMPIAIKFDPKPAPESYSDLANIGLKVNNQCSSKEYIEISGLNIIMRKFMPKFVFTNTLEEAFEESTHRYMRDLGFRISSNSEYKLVFNITNFVGEYESNTKMNWTLTFGYKVTSDTGETLFNGGRVSGSGYDSAQAYNQAISQINWDEIAEQLRAPSASNKKETKKVSGDSDTALEHTIVRWFINSRPAGADVYWRVVSSTPDVHNTNASYIGNTPYESTESFDIKGLSYENSGNVQIEVSCEHSGYLTQKKRFNLRQAIEQKEISAMFNLIKDE